MLTVSRELVAPTTKKEEILTPRDSISASSLSDDDTTLDDLIPNDFKPKNNTEHINMPLVRWRNAFMKISLARRFISNVQLSRQISRGVDIFSIRKCYNNNKNASNFKAFRLSKNQ